MSGTVNRFVVSGVIKGHGGLKDAVAHVCVTTEERAQQIVADGAANGVVRTYRALTDEEIGRVAQKE